MGRVLHIHGARAFRAAVMLVAVTLLANACASAGPGARAGDQSQTGQAGGLRQERILVVGLEHEPNFIAALAPSPGLAATEFYQRPFNAFLDLYDDQNRPLPYLAEALPALNTDSWILFPDGRMETRYHLKPNLVWHDGAPLTAEDFAFTFRVATPGNGFRTAAAPYTVMDDVSAPDDRTIVIHWKALYPDAGVLLGGGSRFGLVPFPRHILEQAFTDQAKETIQDNAYWNREFVGAGPYKLDRWELGSYIEAVAFDQHVLGRPKIDRIRFQFMPDFNATFAGLLAGTVDFALNNITFAHLLQLKQEWASNHAGTADYTAISLTAVQAQFRAEYMNPRAIGDVRVRRALAHGIDKQTFADTIWGGELRVMDTIFEPTTDYYPQIDRAITKYPYDPSASERLMNEAGYVKGPDGFYTSPTEGKLTFEMLTSAARQEGPVLSANWRQIGFDVQERTLNAVQNVDSEVRSTFSALSINNSGAHDAQQLLLLRSSEVSSADTRWRGENRNGWMNAEYDRLVQAYNTTMDPNERIQQRVQIAKLISEELPTIQLSYNPNVHAYLSRVKGPTKTSLYTTGRPVWNIDRWEIE